MKDSAKLLAYFAAVTLGGALLAPPLFWTAQAAAARGILSSLAGYDFESFFHRALLFCALLFLWPLLRSLRIRSRADLRLARNPHAWRDLAAGCLLAAGPVFLAMVYLLNLGRLDFRNPPPVSAFATIIGATIAVPVIEETFFRGLLLGILLRACKPAAAVSITAVFFAILHFLKAPGNTSTSVTWVSGFRSIANAFAQFLDPVMVLAAFLTLLLIGLILADARLRTASLWLPVGLHSGWIFAAGILGKTTKQTAFMLPWLGKNMLVGLIPLALGLVTWALVALLFPYANQPRN